MKTVLFFVSIFCFSSIYAQNRDVNYYIPFEKIYLQTDRTSYSAGDTVWFKTYLSTDNPEAADLTSKVLYVEFINPENKIFESRVLNLKNGVAWGDVVLADTLKNGLYQCRVYTNWQRNWGDSTLYKTTFVVSPNGTFQAKKSNTVFKDIQFFSEGGSLVSGLPSVLAFKITDKNGLGKSVQGKIIDNDGRVAAVFRSNQFGMGSCKIVPITEKTYTAHVQGFERVFKLPTAIQNGYVLSVDATKKDNFAIKIYSNLLPDSSHKTRRVMLIAKAQGKIMFAATDSSGYSFLTLSIPKNKFPTGLVEFSLYDDLDRLQAQRLTFVNHQDESSLQIMADKPSYKPCEKISFDITLKDKAGKPIKGHFAMSVIDSSQDFGSSIVSDLLLTSEFKGRIERPDFYFQNTDESNMALDALLLVEDWQRKNRIDLKPEDLKYEMETGLTVTGRATDSKGGGVSSLSILVLDTKTKKSVLSLTNEQGIFSVSGLLAVDTLDCTIQAMNEKNRSENVTIKLIPQTPTIFIDSLVQLAQIETTQNTDEQMVKPKLFRNVDREYDLKEVKVKGQRTASIGPRVKLYRSDYTITNEQIQESRAVTNDNVLMILQNRIPGVRVTDALDNNGVHRLGIQIRGVSSLTQGTDPLILIDGIPFSGESEGGLNTAINMISALSPDIIESIDVTKSAAGSVLFGSRAASGIIAINTKGYALGSKGGVYNTEGLFRFKIPAFYSPRNFYSPIYEKPTQKTKDYRTTIFWNPNVEIDTSCNANITFYAAGVPATYKVVMEGMTEKQEPVTVKYMVIVK